MKAKQKAEYLYNQMYNQKQIGPEAAKQCALIAVDEIILANPHSNPFNTEIFSTIYYWLDVKKELEKL